jgi:hypothetical protein
MTLISITISNASRTTTTIATRTAMGTNHDAVAKLLSILGYVN